MKNKQCPKKPKTIEISLAKVCNNVKENNFVVKE